jgi:alkylation response protein AidB-like acyl-CoA dehydrogenase
MTTSVVLPSAHLPACAEGLRVEVREFLAAAAQGGEFTSGCDAWLSGFSPAFSRALGERGWLGMTWPRCYGGQERSALERFVVLEELLAAGAPVAAHWVAERQSGPALLRYGTEKQRYDLLPRIAAGECFFCIGMSEPDSGSDLASIRTRATRVDGGWRVTGAKVWTSHAHRSHYMLTLCRTAKTEDRRAGLSQLIIDLNAEGVTVRPIPILSGAHHFNEVILDDVFVSEDMVLGRIDAGWAQVTAELGHERSGPERFLSTFPLLVEMVRVAGGEDPSVRETLGRLTAELCALREMSLGVAAALDTGQAPDTAAALVKDLGTRFENTLVEAARTVLPGQPALHSGDRFTHLVAEAVLHAPGFTLRGGTNEILRGIVARGLGLR